MYKYTLCFIKKDEKILMLNRNRSPWMGIWNGVGGKIESGETPEIAIRREILEETGLIIDHVSPKGTVTWTSDGEETGGMYLFTAEMPEGVALAAPQVTEEGILDWKPAEWLLHPENQGHANVHVFLEEILGDNHENFEFHCVYEGDELKGFTKKALQSRYR